MRLIILVITALIISGCGGKTPSCTDETIVAQITKYADDAIADGLLKNDPDIRIEQMMSQIRLALADITTTEYNKGIDKHSCSANMHVTLPPGVAALVKHRVFQSLSPANLDVDVQGNDIVTPITYTTYRSEKENQLIVRAKNEKIPAKYIQRVHKIGAFDSELRALPDLRLGLTLYSMRGKNVLIEPAEDGSLQFRINFQSAICRPWMQTFTEERGDTLIYDNREVGCSVSFSRLGEIMLVEHDGCGLMARSCYPDGVYRKQ